MYAAAGGASLASRQARQRQRQNKKLQQQKNQSKDLKQPQGKLYHNYTDDAISKLSKVERGVLRPPQHHPAHERRHSASNYNLKEPVNRLKESPSISIPVQNHNQTAIPLCTLVENHHLTSSPSLQLPQIFLPEGGTEKLERRCSFVRQVEEMEKCTNVGLLDTCHHYSNFEIKENCFTDLNRDVYGSLDYPFSECSQGRAAWQERERGRRCSITEEEKLSRIRQSEAHHRWIKRNRIHDLSYGGESEDEDFFSIYHQSAAANALLYVGLGTIAIGSVIFFVGTGEKGFKTVELRLIGPTMVACGLLCCLIRVLLCACPSTCFQQKKKKKTRLEDSACTHNNKSYPTSSKTRQHIEFYPDSSTSLLLDKNQKKKVCIMPPNIVPSGSTTTTTVTGTTTATTTSTSQTTTKQQTNEQLQKINNIITFIPKINLPSSTSPSKHSDDDIDIELGESHHYNNKYKNDNQMTDDYNNTNIIELQNFENEIQSISSNDDDSDDNDIGDKDNNKQPKNKFNRNRKRNINETVVQQSSTSLSISGKSNNQLLDLASSTNNQHEEAYLRVIIENNSDNSDNTSNEASMNIDSGKVTHSGIVLSPLQLEQ